MANTLRNGSKLLLALLLGLCISCSGEDSANSAPGDVDSPEARAKANSDEGAAALAESDKGVDEEGSKTWKQEARDYYDLARNPRNRTFEMPRELAIKFTRDLYQAGAETVWVTRITETELADRKFNMSDDLLAVLPADPLKRKAIFATWNSQMQDDEQKIVDIGQKYLFFVAD